MIFGLVLFFLKVALGIGSFILGLLLNYFEYTPDNSLSDYTLEGIHLITTLSMVFPAIVIILIMSTYQLNQPFYTKIIQEKNQ